LDDLSAEVPNALEMAEGDESDKDKKTKDKKVKKETQHKKEK